MERHSCHRRRITFMLSFRCLDFHSHGLYGHARPVQCHHYPSRGQYSRVFLFVPFIRNSGKGCTFYLKLISGSSHNSTMCTQLKLLSITSSNSPSILWRQNLDLHLCLSNTSFHRLLEDCFSCCCSYSRDTQSSDPQ